MRICVYGASSDLIDESYKEVVEKMAEDMAKRGHSLVFGAGATGLMGAAARGMYKNKGHILGVVPTFFNVDGIIFENCTELVRPETMRERKQIMEDNADGFVMVPGGIGTFEEFFEILTLKQLGRHNKPIAVLNTNGFYNAMQDMMKIAVEHKFIKENCYELYELFDDYKDVLSYLENYVPMPIEPSVYKNI